MDTRVPMLSPPSRYLLAGGVEKKSRAQIAQQISFQHIIKCLIIKQAKAQQKATVKSQSQRMHKLLQVYSIHQLPRIWEFEADTLLTNPL